MNHMRLWISATIIALVIAIGFVLSVPHTRNVIETKAPASDTGNVPIVTVRDVFKKGVHTITGSVETPNACSTASAAATLQGTASSTESILVEISLSNDTGVCLQLPTRTTFQTEISAPALLPLITTVNGSLAATTSP
ncbi:hypothetical protein COX76_00775 [Candidatus Kaiserbacteria bacterium CG_4_10_14_0_2_um_filter_50_16]|nr:MAG: hypothetical protein COX76_00775 [Candidatus Kaiserbacteria bacterium CG_4_10_14_0_2_um_filter_50_16]